MHTVTVEITFEIDTGDDEMDLREDVEEAGGDGSVAIRKHLFRDLATIRYRVTIDGNAGEFIEVD